MNEAAITLHNVYAFITVIGVFGLYKLFTCKAGYRKKDITALTEKSVKDCIEHCQCDVCRSLRLTTVTGAVKNVFTVK
jgi:hypothetical protein